MEVFREYFVATAHVATKHAAFYVGWVRQAYELAGAEIGTPLSPEAGKAALLRIQGLTGRAIVGCCLILLGVLMVQLAPMRRRERRRSDGRL